MAERRRAHLWRGLSLPAPPTSRSRPPGAPPLPWPSGRPGASASGGGSVGAAMAAGGSDPRAGDVEEDASQLIFPKGGPGAAEPPRPAPPAAPFGGDGADTRVGSGRASGTRRAQRRLNSAPSSRGNRAPCRPRRDGGRAPGGRVGETERARPGGGGGAPAPSAAAAWCAGRVCGSGVRGRRPREPPGGVGRPPRAARRGGKRCGGRSGGCTESTFCYLETSPVPCDETKNRELKVLKHPML